MEDSDHRMRLMQEQLNHIETKLDKVLDLLNGNLKANCDKMGQHIDFVERVYDNIKRPLGYICEKVKYMSGSDQISLESANNDSSIN